MPAGPSLADLLRGNHPDYNSDPTYRASMLPVGTYANPDGTESIGFAWPGMIHAPLEAIGRLFGQGTFALGPDAPGNKEDMATLLMSIYGGNALNPVKMAEKAGISELKNSTFSSKNASLYDPPSKAARPFEADYPNGPHAGENEVLKYDIEGRPLTAKHIVGRTVVGEGDTAFPATELDALSEALFGNHISPVASREIGGDAGRFQITAGPDGPNYTPLVANNLVPEKIPRVAAHEVAHGIDYFSGGRYGIPEDGIKREMGQVYHDLNDGSWRRGQPTPQKYQTAPEQYGYKGDNIRAENVAEAIRAYMTDPNYLKTVAPKTAARVREYVNGNPRLNKVIQFNSDTGKPSLFGSAVAGAQSPQRMYHGTAAAEDFSRFQPSAEGSFGPGVYLSESPAVASGRSPVGDGARVFPVDAQGPFASIDDYLTALHANGRDPSAAHRALEQQGYTGVSGDIGSYGAPNPVTNVFAPGSIRSATTGETLFSDTGLPSIWGGAIQDGDSPTLSKILRIPLVTI